MAHTLGFCLFATPIGGCGMAWSDRAITGVQLPEGDDARTLARMRQRFGSGTEGEPPPWVRDIVGRVQRLLRGEGDSLADVPLDLSALGDFHRRVYAATRDIPAGHTMTYGELARAIGEPGAARAVGQALGQNPFAPIVPCHRVLAAGHGPGGFSAEGGVATKLRMLQIERAQMGGQPGLFD